MVSGWYLEEGGGRRRREGDVNLSIIVHITSDAYLLSWLGELGC